MNLKDILKNSNYVTDEELQAMLDQVYTGM